MSVKIPVNYSEMGIREWGVGSAAYPGSTVNPSSAAASAKRKSSETNS